MARLLSVPRGQMVELRFVGMERFGALRSEPDWRARPTGLTRTDVT
jgi:hypothetical protein